MLQIEVIGNIGNDAEIKDFGGNKYVSFNVAHSERKKDANGVVNESTVWVSVLWHGDGGQLTQYLKRGCKIFVRGRLVPKVFIDKNNKPQVGLNMYANEVNLCGSKAENTGNGNNAAANPGSAAAGAPGDNIPDGNKDNLPF